MVIKLSYFSCSPGIGGSIQQVPEDFLVEEITSEGDCLRLNASRLNPEGSGKFLHFVLQKYNWTTNEAIKTVAQRLRASFRRFNFAGNKDRCSISTQLCSGFAIKKEDLQRVRIKDIWINGMWYANDKVHLGQLLGNRFTINVRGCEPNSTEKAIVVYQELKGKIPNYFGEQRFGSARRHTHIIGEKILQGRMEEAAWLYLTDSEGERNEAATQARKALGEHRDFSQALKEFPAHLHYERVLLHHLVEHPNDFTNAFRRFPRNLLLLFIHAFQSALFNQMLSDRLAEGELKCEEGEYSCGENFYGFPDISTKQETGNGKPGIWIAGKLIGYETKLNERERQALEKIGIEQSAFKLPHIPEIHSQGTFRPLLVPLKNFSFEADSIFRFELPSGSYATVAMREFLDVQKSN